MNRLLASLLVLPLVAVCAVAAHAQAGGAPIVDRGVIYATVSDVSLRLDIARPAAATEPVPVVIYLPVPTTKERVSYDAQIVNAAQRGYVGVTMSYHSLEIEDNGKARYPFPTQLTDVKRAIRWLRSHADAYNIDPQEIGVIGWSYGGYLALMAGLTGPADGFEPAGDGPETNVQAVVSLGGFTDWTKMDESEAAWSLGGTAQEIPDVYKKASPLSYVTSDSPPVFLLYGRRDSIVAPEDHAVPLDRKLTDAGARHSLLIINEADHLDVSGYVDKGIVWSFFDQNLKHASE